MWDEVTRFLTNPAQLIALIDERKTHLAEGGTLADLDAVKARVTEIEQEKGRTINLYTKGYITESELEIRLKGVKERLEYQVSEVERLEVEEANTTNVLDSLEDYMAASSTIVDRLDTMDEAEKSETIRLLVDKVIALKDGYKVVLALEESKGVSIGRPRRRRIPCPGHCPT
ncbi:MAG: hypothetical protein IIC99_09885 [Chloroflexi bacterium]|nr:hypothetical protein [Chloroflexota bacterium]